MSTRPLVVVSACLLGEPVRHDGGHTRARFVTDHLANYVDFAPICPEAGAGMATPREAVRVVRGPDGTLSLLGSKTGEDWTARMKRYSCGATQELTSLTPCGFILKKGSPSCGLYRVRRYDAAGNRLPSDGPGLFAEHMRAAFEPLPMEEEGRLNDPALRDQFLTRVFAAHRVQRLRAETTTRADVMAFHRDEKLLLMAHSPSRQTELGRLVARSIGPVADLVTEYTDLFLRTLAPGATRGRMVNVIQHMAGYVRGKLDRDDSAELASEIARFGAGERHGAAVWTLLHHHLRRHHVDYLLRQSVLAPYPAVLLDANPDPHLARAARGHGASGQSSAG